MLIRLAWRNLWRNKRRTLITLFSVAFGVWLCVTMTGLGGYMYTLMIDQSVRMGSGHVTVQPEGALENPSFKKRLSDRAAAETAAAAIPGARAVARIQGAALFSTAARSVAGAFVALDPASEDKETQALLGALSEGAVFPDSGSRGVLVGVKMAEKLKLKLGKKLVVTVTDSKGEVASMLFRVSGIFRSGAAEVDGQFALLPLASAAELLGYGPGETGELAVFLKDQRKAATAARSAGAQLRLPGAVVLDWQETQKEMAGLVKVDSMFNNLFQYILGLMVALGIFNTAFLSVLERKREFGVVLALGMDPARLFRMVVLESLCLGLIGLALGALICVPWMIYMNGHGLDLRSFMPEGGVEAGKIMVEPIYHLRLFPIHYFSIVSGLLVFTVLASLYPAWKAGSLPPVESIKDLG